MNKKARYFFIIAAVSIIVVFFANFDEWTGKKESSDTEFSPSFKADGLGGDLIEHMDSSSMIYSNFKYGFSMNFPDDWTTDRGVSEHTIIRGSNIDSAISFAINVIELADMTSTDITIWELWDSKEVDFAGYIGNLIAQSLNSNPYNYDFRKVYVSNVEAIEVKYNYLAKNVDSEYEVQSILYAIFRSPLTFTVGLHVPTVFYEIAPGQYNKMINDFVIMKTSTSTE